MPTDYLALADTLMEWRAGSEPIYFDGERTGQWEDVPKDFVTLQKEREEAASALLELVAENKALTEKIERVRRDRNDILYVLAECRELITDEWPRPTIVGILEIWGHGREYTPKQMATIERVETILDSGETRPRTRRKGRTPANEEPGPGI